MKRAGVGNEYQEKRMLHAERITYALIRNLERKEYHI